MSTVGSKYPINADTARYVKNPLVVMDQKYVDNTKGKKFREDLEYIKDALTPDTIDTFTPVVSDDGDVATPEAVAAAENAQKSFIKQMFDDTGLAIIDLSPDTIKRFTTEAKWYQTSQRWRETVQYKLDKGLWGWSFKEGVDKLSDLVKTTLGIAEPVSTGKLTAAQMANLEERLEVLANDDTSPYHHMASVVKSMIENAKNTSDSEGDEESLVKQYFSKMLTSYAGAVDALKALAPQLEGEEITSDELLKQAITIITSAEHTMTDDEGEVTTLPTALDNLFNVLPGFDPQLGILVQTISSDFEENETLTQYLRRIAGLGAESNTAYADVVDDGVAALTAIEGMLPPSAPSTSIIVTGKRVLGDKDLVNLSDKALIRSAWLEDGSIKHPTPKYLFTQQGATAVLNTDISDFPSTLQTALNDVIKHLNGVVIPAAQNGELDASHLEDIDNKLSSLRQNMLENRGFFEHIKIEYSDDLMEGIVMK